MVQRAQEWLTSTVRRLWLPDQEKNARTPNSLGNARTRLVVLAGEVGGRWSGETRSFLSQRAKAKARQMPIVLRRRTEQAWWFRWQALLSCTAAKAFAASLLDMRGGQGADGDAPWAHEVENTFKYASLGGLG